MFSIKFHPVGSLQKINVYFRNKIPLIIKNMLHQILFSIDSE